MSRFRDVVELVAAGVMAALVVVVLLQVVARYALRIPLSWSEETARYLLVWGTLLGAAAATARGEHIVIDTVTTMLRGRWLRVVAIVATIGSIAALAVLIWASLPLLGTAGNTTSPGSRIEVRWVRLAIPVGAGIAAVFFLAELVRLVRGKDPTPPRPMDSETPPDEI